MASIPRPLGIACLAAAMWLAALPVHAGTLYVDAPCKVMVRRGQGSDYKIIEQVDNGTQVEVLGTDGGWSLIATPGQRQGWVLSRYLSEAPPAVTRLPVLEEENGRLASRVDGLEQELGQCRAALDMQRQRSASLEQTEAECRRQLEEMRQAAAQGRQASASLDAARQALAERRRENEALRAELTRLQQDQRLFWLLSGGGLVLLGWIIGLVTCRGRKRRSSLL